MLQNLLRSAANYDGLDPVLGNLQALAAAWSADYQEMAVDETIRLYAEQWQSLTAKTVTILDEMSQRLEALE